MPPRVHGRETQAAVAGRRPVQPGGVHRPGAPLACARPGPAPTRPTSPSAFPWPALSGRLTNAPLLALHRPERRQGLRHRRPAGRAGRPAPGARGRRGAREVAESPGGGGGGGRARAGGGGESWWWLQFFHPRRQILFDRDRSGQWGVDSIALMPGVPPRTMLIIIT